MRLMRCRACRCRCVCNWDGLCVGCAAARRVVPLTAHLAYLRRRERELNRAALEPVE
jgi:hypothetical protein